MEINQLGEWDSCMEDLYKNVTKNKYGYYELRQKVEEDAAADFYQNSYYQNETSLYRKKYTKTERQEKLNLVREKHYVIENDIPFTDRKKCFLDIGCGEGFALKYFMEQGYDVLGIELSLCGCEYQNPEVVKKVIQGNTFSVLEKFRPKAYSGTILLDHVLEHVIKPEKLIRKITEISEKGTLLIISVPNDFSKTQLKLWEKGYITSPPFWVSTSYPPEHLSYFNKEALEMLLGENGWKMEIITGTFPIDFNLFNENTNYVKDKSLGKSCHKAAMDIEELMYTAVGMRRVIDIYKTLGESGLGRSITAYFILS